MANIISLDDYLKEIESFDVGWILKSLDEVNLLQKVEKDKALIALYDLIEKRTPDYEFKGKEKTYDGHPLVTRLGIGDNYPICIKNDLFAKDRLIYSLTSEDDWKFFIETPEMKFPNGAVVDSADRVLIRFLSELSTGHLTGYLTYMRMGFPKEIPQDVPELRHFKYQSKNYNFTFMAHKDASTGSTHDLWAITMSRPLAAFLRHLQEQNVHFCLPRSNGTTGDLSRIVYSPKESSPEF